MGISLSLLISISTFGQTEAPAGKMSVPDRTAKARAAKAEKQAVRKMEKANPTDARSNASVAKTVDIRTSASNRQSTQKTANTSRREAKASPADYKSSDKSQRGPNGEVIQTGARGAKYYINKNGNKTYLSSNQ